MREARIHVRHVRDLLKSLDPSDAFNGVDCNSLSFLSVFTDGDLGGAQGVGAGVWAEGPGACWPGAGAGEEGRAGLPTWRKAELQAPRLGPLSPGRWLAHGWPCADQPWVPQTAGSGRRAWRWTPSTVHHLSTSFQGAGSGRCVPCSPRTVIGRWDSRSRAREQVSGGAENRHPRRPGPLTLGHSCSPCSASKCSP